MYACKTGPSGLGSTGASTASAMLSPKLHLLPAIQFYISSQSYWRWWRTAELDVICALNVGEMQWLDLPGKITCHTHSQPLTSVADDCEPLLLPPEHQRRKSSKGPTRASPPAASGIGVQRRLLLGLNGGWAEEPASLHLHHDTSLRRCNCEDARMKFRAEPMSLCDISVGSAVITLS